MKLTPIERCLAGYHDDVFVVQRYADTAAFDTVDVECGVCGATC